MLARFWRGVANRLQGMLLRGRGVFSVGGRSVGRCRLLVVGCLEVYAGWLLHARLIRPFPCVREKIRSGRGLKFFGPRRALLQRDGFLWFGFLVFSL